MTAHQPDAPGDVHVNINVLLPGALEPAVRRANHDLSTRLGSEITFTGDGAVVPHITLLMGTVPATAWLTLVDRVQSWCGEVGPIRFELTDAYMPDRRYVFIAVEPADEMRRRRTDLARAVGRVLTPSANGGPENRTHLTLAYLTSGSAEPLGLDLPDLAGWHDAHEVGIGIVGERGTVTELRHRLPLHPRDTGDRRHG